MISCYPCVQFFWFLRCRAGCINAAITLCGVDQQWGISIGGGHRQLLIWNKQSTEWLLRKRFYFCLFPFLNIPMYSECWLNSIWTSQYLQFGCVAGLTYYTIDAILSHRSFRNNDQVGLNAPFPQVVTAVTSVPWLHIKLTMKTLHGALWDVDTTDPHIQRGQGLNNSLIYQLPRKC